MKLSGKDWYRIRRLGSIIAFWILTFEIFIFVRFYGWKVENQEVFGFAITESPLELAATAAVAALIIGLITGVFEITALTKRIANRSFIEVVGIKSGVYLLTILLAIFLALLVQWAVLERRDLIEALDRIQEFFFSFVFLPIFLYSIFVSLLLSVFLQVQKKFGPQILWNLITGKYHHPKEEERIFMFLDLTGSTTIAEKLGHVVYSRLIQDCFQDLSDILLDHDAHIYQFVGDEAVLTWDISSGLYRSHCIRVFYAFKDQLKGRKEHYIQHYGEFPRFKASVNLGIVSIAEVGDVKSEIAFHGDVLNTGARILEQCKVHQEELLISGQLDERLGPEVSRQYVDKIQLRGKEEEVRIYGVERINPE